ncbi:hypothetical protein C2G38_2168096 [Gigaspora rosea]|uniref:Uncharacterized protein n=1 Tax=Gigaspora rosea TaxID=44941 RepID=A0A397VUF4_9GLOM|nr:hypothetical protein C2G38_2168096 [Gigaspora rosea]
METNTNSKASDEPSDHATISIDMSKIDGNTKAYIDVACQNSANMIITSIKAYIDQHIATQSEASHNHTFQATTTQHKEKQADQRSQSQQGIALWQNSTFKYTAQFNLSRNITTNEAPMLQSVNETMLTVLPPSSPMTNTEIALLKQLDPDYFNIQTPINLHALKLLTEKHPNCPFINYITNGIQYGFRFNFKGEHVRLIHERGGGHGLHKLHT